MEQQTAVGYVGFDFTLVFMLEDVLEQTVNLVGKKAIFSVKENRHADDSTAILKKDFTVTASDLDQYNSKTLLVKFSAEEMLGITEGVYFYDLKIFDPNMSGLIYVPFQELEIIDDVSDRIAR